MARKSKRKLLEEDAQEWILAILSTPALVDDPAHWIGDALLRLIPDKVDHDVAAQIAADIGRRIATDPPESPTNRAFRSMLAVQALNRALDALGTESPERPLTDVLSAWNASEDHYLSLHNDANVQRDSAEQEINRLRRQHGNVLSWNHLNQTKTHRPSHVSANGKNFDATKPPKSTDGLLPGQALHCDCVAGPPIKGAKRLR